MSGKPMRRIALEYGLTSFSISRHRTAHLGSELAALRKREASREQSLQERVDSLIARVEVVLDKVEAEGKVGPFLGSVKELRALLELYGRASGELDTRPTVQVMNVTQSADWQMLSAIIDKTLAPYSDARLAVAEGIQAALEARREPEAG